MDNTEFKNYVDRLEKEVYEYMKECETKTGSTFEVMIAHHAFINPLVLRNVNKKRVAEGKKKCKVYCFVHGTALKMYRWEMGGKDKKNYPMRFHKMMKEENIFNDVANGIQACFVISQEQKEGIREIFPEFPEERIIVSPNGIDIDVFKPQETKLSDIVRKVTTDKDLLWPKKKPTEDTIKNYDKMIIFCGKYAEWKRQCALLEAAVKYEKVHPKLVTLCAGGGQPDDIKKIKSYADKLGLKNTYFIGGRSQQVLAELYTCAELGVFPSYKEPFGLVFIECMACKTPVIGANSGGPKDFVTDAVGKLVDEPPETKDLATVPKGYKTLGETLNQTIQKALKEDWKKNKGDACIKLARDKFTVEVQVTNMLKDAAKFT